MYCAFPLGILGLSSCCWIAHMQFHDEMLAAREEEGGGALMTWEEEEVGEEAEELLIEGEGVAEVAVKVWSKEEVGDTGFDLQPPEDHMMYLNLHTHS